MKHRTNLMMKVWSVLLAVFAFSVYANADNKLSIEDFTIVPGEEKTISVALDNSDPISSLQLDVKLPEGLTYVNKSVKMNADRLKIHAIAAGQKDGATRFLILHEAEDISESAFEGNSGEIFTFKVKAASTFKGGKISVSGISGSDGTVAIPQEKKMADFDVTVNAYAGTYSVSAESFNLTMTENTAKLDIAISNTIPVAGLQFSIDLPKNLVVESFETGDRVPQNYKPKPGKLDESGTVMLSSLMVEEFEGTEGVVLTLNLKANGPVMGDLVIKDFYTTDKTGAASFPFEGEKVVNVELQPDLKELADGDYLIKNVATGKYLGGANAWGTRASLVDNARIFTLAKQESGKYTFDSHAYNDADKHFLNGDWTDGEANEIAIYEIEAGVAFGSSMIACYAAPTEGTEVSSAFVDDANALWEFIPVADAVAALEAGEATDATFLLKDASISRNLYNSAFEPVWEGDAFSKGGPEENQCAEKWGGNSEIFDVHQTINVPNGIYKVAVQGFYRYNNTTDNTNDIAIAAHADGTEVIYSFLYANAKEVALASIADDEAAATLAALPFSMNEASAAFAQGLYNNSVEVEVTDGTLTIGVKKTEHIGCDWTLWDNFTITRTGNILATVDNMTLAVEDGAVIDEEDGTFPVVFNYAATVDESISAMASGAVEYTVTSEGAEPATFTSDFDVDKDARILYIPGLEKNGTYTVAVNSVSVSYFDAETLEPAQAFNKIFEAGELEITFTCEEDKPEPIEPDEWFATDKFKVNEYIDGNRVDVADARFVTDPTNAENGCIEVCTNANATQTWEAQLFIVSDVVFEAGDVVTLEMKVRADREQTSGTQLHKAPGEYAHWQAVGDVKFTTEWTDFSGSVTIDGSWPANMQTIAFNLSEVAGEANNIYFDDVVLTVTKNVTGVDGVNAAGKVNRKVLNKGQIIIIKNGEQNSVSGVRLY